MGNANNYMQRMERLKEAKERKQNELVQVQTELKFKKEEFNGLKEELLEKYGLDIKTPSDIQKYLNEYETRIKEGIEAAEKMMDEANKELR